MSAASTMQRLRFAGYAALFGQPDGSRDTILPGAFARTLADRRGPLPLLWQHRPEQRIGWAVHISEDRRGLRVIAQIDNPASRVARMLRRHEISGLSFGYRADRFHHAANGRVLEDIELFEISLVMHPLQPPARVHLIAA